MNIWMNSYLRLQLILNREEDYLLLMTRHEMIMKNLTIPLSNMWTRFSGSTILKWNDKKNIQVEDSGIPKKARIYPPNVIKIPTV